MPGRVGEVSCAFLWCLARFICRRRRHGTKPIRLHQVWQPAPVDMDEDDLPDRGGGQQVSAPSIRRLLADNGSPDGDQTPAARRRPMTNSRPLRSAPRATAQSGTGRRAGTAWRPSPTAPSRWRPAAACRAIPTTRTAATSRRQSAA